MESEQYLVAWHAANIMNVHTKQRITPDHLLGNKKEMTLLDRENEVAKLRDALAERRARNGK